MPLFDFGRVPVADAHEDELLLDEETFPSLAPSATASLRSENGRHSGGKRRVFDFGEDDELEDAAPDVPTHVSQRVRPMPASATPRQGHKSPEESSLTPASQKSNVSQPPSSIRASNITTASQHRGKAPDEHDTPVSIVDRIWQQSSAGERRHAAGHNLDDYSLRAGSSFSQHMSLGNRAGGQKSGQEAGPGKTLRPPTPQRNSPAMQPAGKSAALKGRIDGIFEASAANNQDQRDDYDDRRAGPLQSQSVRAVNRPSRGHHPQDNRIGDSQKAQHERQISSHERPLSSQDQPFSQAPGARDAWRERGRLGGRDTHGTRDAWSADDHARQVLLSPPRTQAKTGRQKDVCDADKEYFEDEQRMPNFNEGAAVGGWGAESARARGGRGHGRGDGCGRRAGDNMGVLDDHFLAEDLPRPCVPGPAGKLGRVEVGTGRGDGRSSPVLQEQRDEEQDQSREMRDGIVVDSTGPRLPLKRSFLVALFCTVLKLDISIRCKQHD